MIKESAKKSQRVLLILPCYNEGASIGNLLREIQNLDEEYDSIVIDDGSQDNTYEVASRLSPCVKLLTNLGIGGAVQTGIKYAYENDYDLCIQVDGDGQHPPDQIRTLIESYQESPANLLIGSRFLSEGGFRSTSTRRMGVRIIRGILRWLFGFTVTDPTSGFRLMDREGMRIFSADYPTDFPETISLAVALKHRLTVRETPVHMQARKHGNSSITRLKAFPYMLRVAGYLILIRLGK